LNPALDGANTERDIVDSSLHDLTALLSFQKLCLLFIGNRRVFAKPVTGVEEFQAPQEDGYHLQTSV